MQGFYDQEWFFPPTLVTTNGQDDFFESWSLHAWLHVVSLVR